MVLRLAEQGMVGVHGRASLTQASRLAMGNATGRSPGTSVARLTNPGGTSGSCSGVYLRVFDTSPTSRYFLWCANPLRVTSPTLTLAPARCPYGRRTRRAPLARDA